VGLAGDSTGFFYGVIMQHWQQQARNRALTDKRKAHKQGAAIVDYMRKAADDRAKQDEVSQDDSLANIQVVDHQGERMPVRAMRKDEDVEES
jgi:U3 small nucleolar ribonucleoprotein component